MSYSLFHSLQLSHEVWMNLVWFMFRTWTLNHLQKYYSWMCSMTVPRGLMPVMTNPQGCHVPSDTLQKLESIFNYFKHGSVASPSNVILTQYLVDSHQSRFHHLARSVIFRSLITANLVTETRTFWKWEIAGIAPLDFHWFRWW